MCTTEGSTTSLLSNNNNNENKYNNIDEWEREREERGKGNKKRRKNGISTRKEGIQLSTPEIDGHHASKWNVDVGHWHTANFQSTSIIINTSADFKLSWLRYDSIGVDAGVDSGAGVGARLGIESNRIESTDAQLEQLHSDPIHVTRREVGWRHTTADRKEMDRRRAWRARVSRPRVPIRRTENPVRSGGEERVYVCVERNSTAGWSYAYTVICDAKRSDGEEGKVRWEVKSYMD